MAVGGAPAALAQGTGTVGPAGTVGAGSTTTGSTSTSTGSTSTGTTQPVARDESPAPWGLLGLLGLAGLAPLFMRRRHEEVPAARPAPRSVA
jgi:hypothetical protein